jgi:hypothetical protein
MYRVKEVDGIFIPQKLVWFYWRGISASMSYYWLTNKSQIDFCSQLSLEKAKERIRDWKGIEDNVKYHKVK